jgi:hypothetical protein
MTKWICVVIASALCLATGRSESAPLTTTDLTGAVTPTDMVTSLLSGSSGITVSNVAYSGANGASGLFGGGTGIIGFETGVLLTSGSASNVIGPNNADSAGTDNGVAGNAALDALVPGYSTFDTAILQFDFVPTGNTVTFKYVFGSEEYHEFVDSQFNDVFGFFVNGVNVALLPSTSTPVAINNVNCGFADVGSPAPGAGPNCAAFIDNSIPVGAPLDTQLDGLTIVLSTTAAVNPNVLNHMFIGIGDAGDPILDSAVFIQGGSFTVCGETGQPACPQAPEPGTLLLLSSGVAALGVATWMRARRVRPAPGAASRRRRR